MDGCVTFVRKKAVYTWLFAYLVMTAAVIGMMLFARVAVWKAYDTSEARAEWQTWQDDVQRQTKGDGPVQRREPKSEEPPPLVLMRDHFVSCTVFAFIMTSMLFATLMFMIRGASRQNRAC